MQTQERRKSTTAKRAALWIFQGLGTIRNTVIHRAGRLTQPQGKLTLTLNANAKIEKEFSDYLSALKVAA